jgi:tryptophan-rich hypothetical protein
MNQVNPKTLLHSKWTAVKPVNREKHFMVVSVECDEEGSVLETLIEAVLTKHVTPIVWSELADDAHWLHGWK